MAGSSRDARAPAAAGNVERRVVDDPAAPDLYADEFWFSSGAYGATLTLIVTTPGRPGTTESSSKIVGRVRMSPQLANDLARVIQENATAVVVASQQSGGPKH